MPAFVTAKNLSREGLRHCFSLRSGGASAAPFDTLNLGRAVGDDPVNVAENHRRLAIAIGYSEVHDVSQVHGATVHVVRGEPAETMRKREGDALVARDAGVAVGVRVADCAPVLLADPRTGLVAAVHAGWRGAAAGVVAAAVDAMRAEGAEPSRLVAAIGPHIRSCCFEVGDEVVAALCARLALEGVRGVVIDQTKKGSGGREHVDLASFLRATLAGLGVSDVEDVSGCTKCEPTRFFSYRRDGARSGRHMAVIVAPVR